MRKFFAGVLVLLVIIVSTTPAFAQNPLPGMSTQKLPLGQFKGEWKSHTGTGGGQYWLKIISLEEAVKDDGMKYFKVACEVEVYGTGVSRSREASADTCTEAALEGNVLSLKTALRSAKLVVGGGVLNGDGFGTTRIEIKNVKKVQ
jgi:hypothetical protein